MTRYLDLAEYLWLAEQVTGVAAADLSRSGRSDLADSALHAPQAGFGNEDFYPDIYDKAAVLCWRLARNHPLPDGPGEVPPSASRWKPIAHLRAHCVPRLSRSRR